MLPSDADLILVSAFPHAPSSHPGKTVAILWENIRPDYRFYCYSISSDFDNYGGRNVRCPYWYSQIEWSPEMAVPPPSGGGAHNREQLVSLDLLMADRVGEFKPRPKFCGFVASNYEPFRMTSASALMQLGQVDVFGRITGKPDERSKYDILRDYAFSLCFENS